MFFEIQNLVQNLNIEIISKEIIKIKQKNPSTFLGKGNLLRIKNDVSIKKIDLLIINKIDLAPHVGASLDVMEGDTKRMRGDKPFVFSNLKKSVGVKEIEEFIISEGMI